MTGLGSIRFRTERLVLRPLRAADQAEFTRVHRVSREEWRPWTPARSQAAADVVFREELDRTRKGAAAGTHLRLWAFEEGGALVGMFSLNEIVRGVFQSAYAGWQVSADRMGRGFGTEGVRGLIALAFSEPPNGVGLHRVQANIMPDNGASLRIAEKVGLRREGFAERYLEIAGRWEDHVMFAVTREEWGD